MPIEENPAESAECVAQTMRSSLLFVHPGSLGDAILALAALRGLHARFHFARRIFVGQQQIGQLFLHCGEVDMALSFEHTLWTDCLLSRDTWQASTERIMDSVSHAVVWMNDADGTVAANLKRAGIPWTSVRSPNSTDLEQEHQEDRYLEILRDWDVRRPAWRPLCPMEKLHVSGSPLLVIHPGSGSPHKCLPPQIWAEAVRQLISREPAWTIALIGGPADEITLWGLRRALDRHQVQVFHNYELATIASLLASADLFWGHDSGPTHVAAAAGTPTVAVFGPTSPARWAPRGPFVRVVQGSACQCRTWDDVRACVSKPCLAIDPAQIVQHSQAMLGGLATVSSFTKGRPAWRNHGHLTCLSRTPMVHCRARCRNIVIFCEDRWNLCRMP